MKSESLSKKPQDIIMNKRILFLSALDFKQKSIQVIRKTPEAYIEAGWDVHYIVARDTFCEGNYAYEPEINPEGMRIDRFAWPLVELRNTMQARWPLYLWTRLASLLVIAKLAYRGAKILRDERVDIVYGYEMHGVLAVKLLRLFRLIRDAKVVNRFQGTCYVTEMLDKKQLIRQAANVDYLMALRASCDLAIMTNDGTRGNIAMKRLGSSALANLRFWVNGTDLPDHIDPANAVRRGLTISPDAIVLLSVSRLVAWKRLDRGFAIAAELSRLGIEFVYVVVGEGSERNALERLAEKLGIKDKVRFTGAVSQVAIYSYMNAADVFISTYDMSNVGNPLLEAIRMEKMIVTLNNGDTGQWITHEENGLIYDVSDDLPRTAARDIARLLSDRVLRERIEKGVRKLATDRLWTWSDRMGAEVAEVEALLEK